MCSVILGKLESFGNYKGFNVIFSKILDETFSDLSLHCIFESENFRFPFLYENSLTWEVKCEIKLAIVGILLDISFENCT